MKKIFILSTLCMGIIMQLFSQGVTTVTSVQCGGVTTIAPRPTASFGLTPSDSFLACVVQGQLSTADTLFITNLTTVPGLGVTVDSLTIDSIYLPSGLCWQTNSATNTIGSGASGVILLGGTTTDSAGQYLLRIIVTAYLSGIGPYTINLESEGLYYSLRVRTPICSCTPIVRDTVDAFVAYTASCGFPITAAISPSGIDSVCAGDSATLIASAGSGNTYLWSNGATTQSVKVPAGSYTVKVYNAGDSATSAATVVVARPAPTDSITDSGSGSSQTLTVAGTSGTYVWYLGSSPITGATGSTYSPLVNGTYSVWVTTNCRLVVSNSITVVGVGINEISANAALRLYPNPSQGIFTLDAPGCIGSYYEITDELGRTVQKKLIQADNSLVDVSSQPSGVYFLTVQVGQQNQTIRFVISK